MDEKGRYKREQEIVEQDCQIYRTVCIIENSRAKEDSRMYFNRCSHVTCPSEFLSKESIKRIF